MLAIRVALAISVLYIQTCSAVLSDGKFNLLNVGSPFCITGSVGRGCVDLIWSSSGRLFAPGTKECVGAQDKTEGSSLKWCDCDEGSKLQQWECNNTLVALKGQNLFMHIPGNSPRLTEMVLSKETGPKSQFVISGTSNSACSKTYREYFTIDGNAHGRPCQFPFFYKGKWYGDCTKFDSNINRDWCAVTTRYENNELWGYCPSESTDHWSKNPVTEVFYQINSRSALTWHQARQSCQQQGSDLVSITEPHEQAYVTGLLGQAQTKLWIGLNSLDQESGWQWSSGKPLRYLRWDAGHPLPDPGQSCVLMDSEVQSYWQSSLCSKKLGYICQRHKPEPPVTPVEQGFCAAPWIPYAGYCYRLQRDKKTWLEARSQCRKDGGDLASLHNIEEQSFVISQLGYMANDVLWTGLNDQKTSLLFEWSDHSSVSFTQWAVGQPPHVDTRRKHCVLIKGAEGKWSSGTCENRNGFICKTISASKPDVDIVESNPGCKPGWKRHGAHCYLTGAETKTFEEAKAACRSSGSDLVDISHGIDNVFLVSMVGMRSEKHFWIGLSNAKNSEYFEWTNKKFVTYSHWNAKMPGREKGCVAITTGIHAGLWDVLSCTNKEKYICKHLAEGVTTTVAPTTPVPSKCAEDWNPVGQRHMCFKFFTGPRSGELTWFEARDYCRTIGAELLSLHSDLEVATITRGKAWVGLSAPDPNSGWVWSDGSPFNYQNWQEGEPNNHMGVESCIEHSAYGYSEGHWNDVHCESYNDWLCQIPKGVTPHPPPNDTIAEYNMTEDGWLEYNGYQYYINNDVLPMLHARDYCKQNHGDLAVITGEKENSFLWKQISRNHGDYYTGLVVEYDQSFGWIDGSPLVFQRWYQDYPNFKSFDENCVAMEKDMGFWKNFNCGVRMKSFCKRSSTPPVNSTVAPTAAPKGGCAADWVRFRSKCYKFHTSPESWHDARTHCQSMAGNLVSIVVRQVQVFLMSKMPYALSTDLWIGLTIFGRNQFLWTDNQPCLYVNWAKGEPDPHYWRWGHRYHSLENECVVLSSGSSSGKWMTKNCNDTHGYICQRRLDSNLPAAQPTSFSKAYVKLGNDSYKVVTQSMTWQEAKSHCERDNAQLASLLTDWAEAYIELQVFKLNTPVWIGLNKKETDGFSRWIDNWRLRLTNWGPSEPIGSKPCVYIDVDGLWKTSLCNHTFFSVCKQSKDTPPPLHEQYEGTCVEEEGMEDMSLDGPVSWFPFRGHCYTFFLVERQWSDAVTRCMSIGANLLSIEDSDEQSFITSNMEAYQDSHTTFWIGLYKTIKDEWLWLDKTVFGYNNWGEIDPDSPFGGIQTSDGQWTSEDRWTRAGYICKKAKGSVIEIVKPTLVSKMAADNVHSGIAVAVVLIVLSVLGATAFILYKRSGHSLTLPFANPLYFNQEHSQGNIADSNKLIDNTED